MFLLSLLSYKEKNFHLNKEIFLQIILGGNEKGLSIKPRGEFVEPCPTETEPAAGAHLLTAETQDETAVA